MTLTKRDLITALVALGAAAVLPSATAEEGGLDLSAGRAIADAYRAGFPGEDLAALRGELLPSGVDAAALARLQSAAADDFREGRVFVHAGWRLSRTEGRLFALLTAD